MPTPHKFSSTAGTAASAQELGRRYLFVLGSVAILVLLDQAVVQPLLFRLNGYAPVINVAGRQRMLSQRIAKAALAIDSLPRGPELSSRQSELAQAVSEWEQAHLGLQHGDPVMRLPPTRTANILAEFQRIAPDFLAIRDASRSLLRAANGESRKSLVDNILSHERDYLEGMHEIVGLYEAEAQAEVNWLRTAGVVLSGCVLLLLAGMGRYVLNPAVRVIRDQVTALSDSETRHRQLIEQMSDGLAIFERGGRITYVNDRLSTMLERSRDEIIGTPLSVFSTGDDRQRLLAFLEHGGASPGEAAEFTWKQRSGDPIVTLTTINRYFAEATPGIAGGTEVYFAVMTDITEQRRAAEAVQNAHDELEQRVRERTAELLDANAALRLEMVERQDAEERSRQLHTQLAHTQRLSSIGQLATGLAHELNQPLGAVVNYAETASVLLTQPEGSRDAVAITLRRISEAALRAGEIVRRIRNFVRKGPGVRSEVRLSTLIRDVLEICEPEALRSQVQVTSELPNTEDDRVLVDSIQ
ncbi:MAG: type IV pili methyl-accepting chemotaxis transducer N-terminal domain-containing protein, partial [Planctomycetaceae bacterium]|nr:type IV pili methyl-accepting chemotaxis transducer N-terminal domain-containing protein [Planctomycetaceae bacterium]